MAEPINQRTLIDAARRADPPQGALSRWWGDDRRIAYLLLAAVTLGVLCRLVRYLMDFPLWGDEASLAGSLLTRDYAGMMQPPLEYHQIAPLGYLWLELALVKCLGLAEWVLRLPAFAAALASMILLGRFAAARLGARAAVLAVVVLAVSEYPVRHGAELKPYSTDLLISLVLTMLAWAAGERPGSPWRWAALVVTAALGPWLSFPSIFVVGGAGIYLMWAVLKRPTAGSLAGLAAYGLAAAGSFLAVYLIFLRPMEAANASYFGEGSQWAATWPPIREFWKLPWWLLDTHAGRMLAYPIGDKNFGSTATLLAVAVGCVVLWRAKRRGLLLLLLAPLALNLLAACLKKYPYGGSARTMLYAAPAICLLGGEGLARMLAAWQRWPRWRVDFTVIMTLLIGAWGVLCMALDIAQPYKTGFYRDLRSATHQIAAKVGPNDRLILADATAARPDAPRLMGSNDSAFRYHITWQSRGRLAWSPPPAQVEPAGGRTWVLHYLDPKGTAPGQAILLDRYLAALEPRLGTPRIERYPIGRPGGSGEPIVIFAYVFEGKRD